MSKAKGPLLSLSATHRLGTAVTFRRRAGGTIAQRRTIPVDSRSPAQLQQRALFATILPWWHALLATSRETYRLIDPRVNYNAAYINFMRYQLMNQLVDHHTQHQRGGADEVPIQTLESSAVGPSGTPLYNLVLRPNIAISSDSGWTSSYAFVAWNLAAFIPAGAVGVLLLTEFIDTGSAGAPSNGRLRGSIAATYHQNPGDHNNNTWVQSAVLIAPISGQQVFHAITATGVNTARFIIYLLGWIEPVED